MIPSQVLRRTEAISRSMQNLLTSLKDGKQENILACSKRIIGAVRELILLFPEVQNNFTKALFKIHSKPIVKLGSRSPPGEPGVVILHIENKSAPLRGGKIINLPQNRAMNFQKSPYF